MKNKFVDTNIFIEVFARSGTKSQKSIKLLKDSLNLCTSSLVVSEIEWVLRYAYDMKREKIIKYIKRILSSNIEVDNKKLLVNAVHFYEANNVDWTDCLNMFLAKESDIKEVYSYDKGIDKYTWIKRIEP